MRILAQASFATGVMGEIGRVLDGTGEKEKSLLYLLQSAISVIDFGPKSTITSMLAKFLLIVVSNQILFD